MRRIALNAMREEMFGCMRGARPVEPAPLVEFLADETHSELLCEGLSLLGTVHGHLGQPREMVAAWRRAWKLAPASACLSCGNSLAWDFWERRDALEPADRAFALEVSRTVVRELGDARGDDALRAAFLDTLACCQWMNGEREAAIATVERCLELVPGNDEYTRRLEAFRAG
jgi:hypothetical protein